MAEDTKDKGASQRKDPEEEKKQAPTAVTPARPAQVPPPRPVVPPRPPAPPAAPSQPPRGSGRRGFIKALLGVSAVLAIIPFVPWESFLLSSVSSTGAYKRQRVTLDQNTPTNHSANGAVAGRPVNVNDLASFPANGSWLLTYPSSGDITIDSNNPDTFQKFGLIRLPKGTSKSAADFVAFSKVCVHLWCSPNYDPQKDALPRDETYQCPCHGTIYRVPDGLTIDGPASKQASPTNAIPMLTLTADSNGDLYIEPPLFDAEHNGIIGYGRDYESYEKYILPIAQGKEKPPT